MTRRCPICGDELPATAHRLKKICDKPECRKEQMLILGRRSYHRVRGHGEREQRSCVVCSADITALRTNRVVCMNPDCKAEIVRRTKAEHYQRVHGTPGYAARVRASQQAYRAKRKPAAPPKKPVINTKLQRKPKAASKFEIKPKPIAKPRARSVKDDTPYTPPKPFNLPESMPMHVATPVRRTVIRSDFEDPWDCQACRDGEKLCRLHQSMTDDGSKPPANRSY